MPNLKTIKPFYIAIFLSLFGLYYITTTTFFESQSTYGDGWYYPRRQANWFIVSILVYFVVKNFSDLQIWRKYSVFIYLASCLSLVLVLLPGIGHKAYGAQRWINIAGFTFQPVEFYKLAAILYFSNIFTKNNSIGIRQILITLGVPVFLIILQPNMSSACICVSIVLLLYLITNQSIKKLTAIFTFLIPLAFLLIVSSEYRKQRLVSLLKGGDSYHSQQVQKAVSSGGLFGVGLGNSEQKYKFVPQLAKDSIAATITEELGLFGLISVLVTYAYLCFCITKSCKDDEVYKITVACGYCFWVLIQVFVNIASLVGIIPLTGVTLPFISYGGSSLLLLFIPLAILRL